MKKIINIVLLLGIIGVAVLFFVLDPNKHEIFPRCLFHSLTGGYCPGCGSQRALHSLLYSEESLEEEEGEEKATKDGLLFMECSAKAGYNVKSLFRKTARCTTSSRANVPRSSTRRSSL